MTTAEVGAMMPDRTMTIKGAREPRYWRETEDEHGHWVSTGQSGPIVVVVTWQGIQIVNNVQGTLRPSTARWLACRLIEAGGIYEAVYGGDGSVPQDGKVSPLQRGPIANVSPIGGDLQPEPETSYVCGCGKASTNKGAMKVHEKSCPDGPVKEVTGGND